MELAAQKPGMIGEFDDLDEFAVGRFTRKDQAVLAQPVNVDRVEFVAMAMTFADLVRAVDLLRQRAVAQFARIRAEPHRAA